MDKQQVVFEAFVEWLNSENSSAVKLRGKVCPSYAAVIWQAAQAALMPALVEARDVLDGYLNLRKDKRDLREALTRINAIIGDKK